MSALILVSQWSVFHSVPYFIPIVPNFFQSYESTILNVSFFSCPSYIFFGISRQLLSTFFKNRGEKIRWRNSAIVIETRSSWKVYSVLRKLRRWIRKFNSQLYVTIEPKFVEFCRSLKDTMLTKSTRKIDGTKCENKMIERQFSNIDSSLGAIYNGLNFNLDGSSSTRSRN